MKVAIIGTGYVGLCTAIGLTMKGHSVTCIDIDNAKVEMIRNGKPPFYEPGVEKGLKDAIKKGKLTVSTDLQGAVKNCEVVFISVGTPSRKDGSIDLSYIESAAQGIGKALKACGGGWRTVVVKSTVVPGTTEGVVLRNIENGSGKKAGIGFGLAMNPEFLREGHALEDFLNPDRIVIGQLDAKSGDIIDGIYTGFEAPKMRTDLKTAEMIKYAANTFLASKISLINEIGNLCKILGIDTNTVADGIGHDRRIGRQFLNAGIGFGGSCFPKDVKALAVKAKEVGYEAKIMNDVLNLNEKQPLRIIEILKKHMPSVSNKTIAVLGLSFKPETDDIRESPSIKIVKVLLDGKANINAYDPKAMDNFRRQFPQVNYFKSARDALNGADACLLLTEWDEFKALTDSDFSSMKGKIIIEGRKMLNKRDVNKFEGVCW